MVMYTARNVGLTGKAPNTARETALKKNLDVVAHSANKPREEDPLRISSRPVPGSLQDPGQENADVVTFMTKNAESTDKAHQITQMALNSADVGTYTASLRE